MPYGIGANCVRCKILTSQVLHNSNKERICADCLQEVYDAACVNLERSFDELYKATNKIQKYEKQLEQIKDVIKD